MLRIVFALASRNPWRNHLGTAAHLGATGYYIILTDEEPLLETLALIPEGVKLITVSATVLEQPTRLEEHKDSKFGGRTVGNTVNVTKPALPVPRDIHRHIMSFLSGRDSAKRLC